MTIFTMAKDDLLGGACNVPGVLPEGVSRELQKRHTELLERLAELCQGRARLRELQSSRADLRTVAAQSEEVTNLTAELADQESELRRALSSHCLAAKAEVMELYRGASRGLVELMDHLASVLADAGWELSPTSEEYGAMKPVILRHPSYREAIAKRDGYRAAVQRWEQFARDESQAAVRVGNRVRDAVARLSRTIDV